MTEKEAPIYGKLRKAEKLIKKQLLWCIPLSLFAIGAPLGAWFGYFLPEGEEFDIWFQRSGSITVLFAVWMEYNIMKVNEDVNPSGHAFTQQIDLAEKYKTIFKIAQYIIAVLAITGTVIWGYGDLLR